MTLPAKDPVITPVVPTGTEKAKNSGSVEKALKNGIIKNDSNQIKPAPVKP